MKKNLLFIVILTALNTLTIDAQTNNVGVGTDAPTNRLTVNGNASVGTGYIGISAPVNGAIIESNVGIGSSSPNVNASLELGANNKGFLPNRVALTATNLAAPLTAHVQGMVIYNMATAGTSPNNVTPGLYYNDGTKWVRLGVMATTLVNVTASRAHGVNYTNTLPYPITVMYTTGNDSNNQTSWCYVNNILVAVEQSWPAIRGSATFTVPAGGVYRIEIALGATVATVWSELR